MSNSQLRNSATPKDSRRGANCRVGNWELARRSVGSFRWRRRRLRSGPEWPTETAPRPLAAREVKFPPYQVRTLSNGMQVIAVAHHEQPAVTMRLLVRAGAAQDPEKQGRTRRAGRRSCSTRGRRREAREQIADRDRFDRWRDGHRVGYGSDLRQCGRDEGFLRRWRWTCVHDVVRHPAFSPEEIERQTRAGDVVTARERRGSRRMSRRCSSIAWSTGSIRTGCPAAVRRRRWRASRRTICERSTAQYFVPNNMILGIVGDIIERRGVRHGREGIRQLATR